MLTAVLGDTGLEGAKDSPEGIWVMSHSVNYV